MGDGRKGGERFKRGSAPEFNLEICGCSCDCFHLLFCNPPELCSTNSVVLEVPPRFRARVEIGCGGFFCFLLYFYRFLDSVSILLFVEPAFTPERVEVASRFLGLPFIVFPVSTTESFLNLAGVTELSSWRAYASLQQCWNDSIARNDAIG